MSTPTLEQTQRLLWKLITAPEGAASGLAQLSAAERDLAASLIGGDARLAAIDRVEVYADMYFYRIRDCLKEDFAAVCAVVGEAHFHNLITDYLLAHPPSHFSLRYAGRHLPEYLERYALARQWPCVADLARLEWAIVDVFDAPDVTPIGAAELAAVPQEQWPEVRFQLTPALRVLRLQWPVHTVWQQVQQGEPPADPVPGETTLRVWRQDLRVFHRPVDAAEAAALEAVAHGESFASVCGRVGELLGEAAGAERVAQLLESWFADGLITGCCAGDAQR